jgi:DNA-binding transcriptional regulator YhcF (GntR family)
MSISTDLRTKNEILYECKNCDFITRKKTDFNRHLTTQKHQKINLATNININSTEKNEKVIYQCDICQKTYLERTGLWRHKKKCFIKEKDEDDTNDINKISQIDNAIDEIHPKNMDKEEIYDLVKYLIKENSELKSMIVEVCKSVQPVNNTTNNNNCHNKTFNLNVFLNEQCKDAINMSDFIDSIIVNLSDLETTGRLGYAEGLSKLFITHLQRLDKHKRPIHCSDLKREVLYIKDENQWGKDTDDKQRLQQAIKEVTYKNIRQIAEWVKKYPDCRQADSRKNDQYIRITMNSMSGGTEEEQERNMNKIIANIAREVVIEK